MNKILLDAAKFFTGLTPSKMINIVLVAVIAYFIWHNNKVEDTLVKERDDIKNKYDQLYIRYTQQVDKNQNVQNQIKDDCNDKIQAIMEQKERDQKEINRVNEVKYHKLLKLLENKYYKNGKNN